MIEIELTRAIRERITQAVAEMRLQTDIPNELKAPQVVNGYLPPKRSNNEPDFPYIIVRPNTGATEAILQSKATVKLLIGCYSEEYDGYEYALQVLAVIRKSLMENPTLENTFRMEMPFNWLLYDDQPYPEWAIEVTTVWTIHTPLEIQEEGVL